MPCSEIETCTVKVELGKYKDYCQKKYTDCWRYRELHTETKTPKEWRQGGEK
jgi:hypothetical protein